MNKTAFIITTFERDELLFKSIESLLPHMQEDWNIVIVDQGKLNPEKENWLNNQGFDSVNYSRHNDPQNLFYYQVPFDSGLSYCRNYGVDVAKDLGCEYCVIGSDSFGFDRNIKRLCALNLVDNDLIGFELYGCKCGWEAKLKLIEGETFELDFIDKSKEQLYHNVDICRNFFITKTDTLLNSPWDENFKLGEHEDMFYRLKLKGIKCVWTHLITATKMTDRPTEYAKLRKLNFDNGLRYLREKWGIKGWVSYVNLDRAKINLP